MGLIFAALAAFAIGMGNTVKGGINSTLAQNSSVETATFISFLGALVLLLIVDMFIWLVAGNQRDIPRWKDALFQANRWELIGGLLGFFSLSIQTFSIYYLGASLMKVLLCTTEVVSSVVFDVTGALQPHAGNPLTWITISSVLFCLVGAALTAWEDWASPRLNESILIKAFACVGPLVAGFCRPLQARVNSALATTLNSKIRATEWSFFTGTLCLYVGTIINMIIKRNSMVLLESTVKDARNWWMFCGGPFSLATVFGAIVLPPFITLRSHFICMTSGQLVMALYLDSIGAFLFEQKDATRYRIVGTSMTCFGAILSRLQSNRDSPKLFPLLSDRTYVDARHTPVKS